MSPALSCVLLWCFTHLFIQVGLVLRLCLLHSMLSTPIMDIVLECFNGGLMGHPGVGMEDSGTDGNADSAGSAQEVLEWNNVSKWHKDGSPSSTLVQSWLLSAVTLLSWVRKHLC